MKCVRRKKSRGVGRFRNEVARKLVEDGVFDTDGNKIDECHYTTKSVYRRFQKRSGKK